MKALVLYHPKSDHGGIVEDYAREFESYKGKKLELVSLETQQGADLANLYDITTYPAILAIDNRGTMQRIWQGMQLPLMDELSYYIQVAGDDDVSHETRTLKIPTHLSPVAA